MTHYGNVRRLLSFVRRALDDYDMIEDGDRIAVGVSGGKDSLALLCAMAEIRLFYPKKFELFAIHLDPGFYNAGFCEKAETEKQINELRSFCDSLCVPLTVVETSIAEIVFKVRREENPCSLCSRMRRGALHNAAKELDCNKMALGHHFDDAVETFVMNLFNEGRIGSFSPVTYLDRRDITIIRPLIYCPEKSVRYYVNHAEGLPIMASPCPADRDSERQRVKDLLYNLEKDYDGLKHRIFGAMQRADIDGFGLGDKKPYKDMGKTPFAEEITNED
ncbi:MAG: tRNA 2-thiocytidine(32) synthetase TtcA [Clostridia bacterium]|nr:tRNA 2-thiocytidine(32) synthetase TtcA [Clostridia bacterium]